MHFAKNPFPGMNPWLESYWGDIHTSLTTYARDAIQKQLPSDLRHNESDIRLPLQSLVNLAYENGRYGNAIDYSKPPEIPLAGEDEAWIQAWLVQQAVSPS